MNLSNIENIDLNQISDFLKFSDTEILTTFNNNVLHTDFFGSVQRKYNYHSLNEFKYRKSIGMNLDGFYPHEQILHLNLNDISLNEYNLKLKKRIKILPSEELLEKFTIFYVQNMNKNLFLNIIELGAGYGNFLIENYIYNFYSNKKPFFGIGIELEKNHYKFLLRNIKDNENLITSTYNKKIVPIYGGIHHENTTINVEIKSELESRMEWGKGINNFISGNKVIEKVNLYSLIDMLKEKDYWNLIHMDIQGTEFDLINYCFSDIKKKVKYLYIGTHGNKIESNLLSLFNKNNFKTIFYYPNNTKSDTLFGSCNFGDGVLFVENKNI